MTGIDRLGFRDRRRDRVRLDGDQLLQSADRLVPIAEGEGRRLKTTERLNALNDVVVRKTALGVH
jgi:hypothetical protein